MKIFVNSESRIIPDDVKTVAELLKYLSIPEEGTGVGINNRLIVHRNWNVTTLEENDNVVIISATYGG